ncbi:MAG: LLM class F420-dependent oxidoreductase [Anaerolineae bacterium]|nr:LLM class F420-dependent oxidoreductase [Anaerolineae bacterium]
MTHILKRFVSRSPLSTQPTPTPSLASHHNQPLRFGYQNPSFVWPDHAPYEIFEHTQATAHRVEEMGFYSFWLMDHLIQIPGVGAPDEPFLEGWSTLAALAPLTQRIRLGILVTCIHYRTPALLAKMATGIDVISRGRLIMGIGAGWYDTEYKQYGYDFPIPAIRIRQLAEGIQVIKAMWTTSRATYEGKYYQIKDAILEPKPIQKPHPPILVGGGGEQLTLRVLARHGDAANLFGAPPTIAHKIEVLRGHCEKVGRDFGEIEITKTDSIIIAKTPGQVQAKLRRLGWDKRPYKGLSGTPTEVTEQVRTFQALGVTHLIVNVPGNDEESLALFAEEVMPAFQT